MTMNFRSSYAFALVASLVTLSAPPLHAQRGKWEIDGHVGGVTGSGTQQGSSTALPVAQSFVTVGGRQSRRVSSWYFGDGTTLFNQVLAQFPTGSSLPRMTALDPVLAAQPASRSGGFEFGARVSRRLTSRLT